MIQELFNISERLKQLREHKGITQTELAKLLSLTRSSVNGGKWAFLFRQLNIS